MMCAVPKRLSRMAAHVASPGIRASSGAVLDPPALPELYFGTMTFGWNQASSKVDEAVASAMVKKFLSSGCRQIDSARIYSAGDTEDILGNVLQTQDVMAHPYIIGTKAHPSQPGGLSNRGIRAQLAASLKALQIDKVEVLYLHQPDPENDLLESLECVQELIAEGLISKYGMSNYSALEVDRCCKLCAERGWTTPSFYQGLYNPLNRLAEEELLPVLRKHAVAFIAYNPLAAGLLTGKHSPAGDVMVGRFKDNPNYLPRFYTEANFSALAGIQEACGEAGLGMVPATYSWLLKHSQLDARHGDGLLLGASSLSQLEQNLEACLTPVRLPPTVISAFNSAWATTICFAPFPYWRSYSRDQPGRETLPPGAAYNATKK
ncbi:unnamed protein product [Polarella glacialis]|uniref:NADP-dependent oxidoreductase domain-containing protein n=1 Tax=Polarella glacialis TaxID=89957 RepID=A0A813L0F8_POLGL|nr:unnamed protein product [Polarella glacialis]CAE8716650.1 unnamed protein product [Polarella glacialis]